MLGANAEVVRALAVSREGQGERSGGRRGKEGWLMAERSPEGRALSAHFTWTFCHQE